MSDALFPPLKPLLITDRVSMIFIGYGQIDELDGACIMLEPARVSRTRLCMLHPRPRE